MYQKQSTDKYLNSLNKKIKGYIDKAIKVSSMEYNNIVLLILFPQDPKQIELYCLEWSEK